MPIPVVTMTQMSRILDRLLLMENPPVIHIVGVMGVGKSALIKEKADQYFSGHYKDIRLPLYAAIDLKGMPAPDWRRRRTAWFPNDFLPDPERDGLEGIGSLEEFKSAERYTLLAAYQLAWDRMLGEYKWPSGWRLVATSNRRNDLGLVNELLKPLANRMVHFEVEPDVGSWTKWALAHGIRGDIIGFINWKGVDALSVKEPPVDTDAFHTGRSWETASRVLDTMEGAEEDDVKVSLMATVGDIALEFLTFKALRDELPNPEEILEGSTKLDERILEGHPDRAYAIISAVVSRLASVPEPKLATWAQNATKFLAGLPHEWGMAGIQMCRLLPDKIKAKLMSKNEGFAQLARQFNEDMKEVERWKKPSLSPTF